MHAWEAIQTTLDYIETHMDEALEIEALAEQAALSPFYYQRLFSRGSSSVPAHVEMMGLIGMGNNPMVGASVAVAVAVEESFK